MELHRPGAGPQFHLVVIWGVSKAPVFVRERRVRGPGLQGEPVGWAVCCRPGALTGRSEGSESSMGGLWVWWPHWVTQGSLGDTGFVGWAGTPGRGTRPTG